MELSRHDLQVRYSLFILLGSTGRGSVGLQFNLNLFDTSGGSCCDASGRSTDFRYDGWCPERRYDCWPPRLTAAD